MVSRSPWKQIRDRSAGRVPTAERSSGVPISQLPLKSVAPPFSISGVTTIKHRSVHLVDILLDIPTSPDMLSQQLIFSDTQLSRWHEIESAPALARLGKSVRGKVAREVFEGRKSDVLVWWPSIWQIPLETGFDERSGESSVVSVHDQVDGREGAEGLGLVAQDIWRNDSDPEGVEGGGGVEVVTGVRGQVVVVERELVGIPEEIEDTSAEPGSGVPVTCSLGSGSGPLVVISED